MTSGFATTASAAQQTTDNTAPIAIGDQVVVDLDNPTEIAVPASDADVVLANPSAVQVTGASGLVQDVAVTLNGLSYPFVGDLDVMLVGPQGQQVMLMSDLDPDIAVDPAADVTFNTDPASGLIGATLLDGAVYHPTDLVNPVAPDDFPAPAPATTADRSADLTTFNGTDPNGTWTLYVLDNFGTPDTVANGWALHVATDTVAGAAASTYPSRIAVSGLPRGITDVDVSLKGLDHNNPDSIDAVLVSPAGQSVLLMSDAGGTANVTGLDLSFDDGAAGQLPDDTELATGTFKPTNFPPDGRLGDTIPGLGGQTPSSTLAALNGADPNGDWKLFIVDQDPGVAGQLAGGWTLRVTTVDLPGAATLAAPANGATDDDGLVTFSGTGQAGGTVRILEGSAVVASTLVSAAGAYSVSPAGISDGVHTYTAVLTDRFGNVAPASAPVTVTVDKVAPVGTIKLNAGAVRTNKTAVRLSLTASDPAPSSGAVQMRFSNDDRTFSAFEPFAASKAWTLSSGDGTKTVWAQYADRAGKVSGTVAASIVLDTVGPKVLGSSPDVGATRVGIGRSVTMNVDEALTAASVRRGTVTLLQAGRSKAVRAAVSYSSAKKQITLNPVNALRHRTTYRVTVSTLVTDLVGNRLDQSGKAGLQSRTWRFTTR